MKIEKIFSFFAILFIVVLCFSDSPEQYIMNKDYIYQIQFIRQFSLQFKISLLSAIVLMMLITNSNLFKIKKLRFNYFFKLLLLTKILYAFKLLALGSLIGLQEFVLFFSLITFVFYLSNRYNHDSVLSLIYYSSLVFLFVNILQIIINPEVMFIKQRFVSVTGNANHAGVAFFCFLPSLLYVHNVKHKLVSKILIFLFLFFVLISGSRTAFLGVILFFILLYRIRLRLIIFSIVSILIADFILFQVFDNLPFSIQSSFERASLESNRVENWLINFQNFIDNPFFGRTDLTNGRLNVIENSYIAALSNYGLVGAISFFIAIIFLVLKSLSFLNNSDYSLRLFASFAISMCVMAFFEGFLLGNLTLPILMLFLYTNTYLNNKTKINLIK